MRSSPFPILALVLLFQASTHVGNAQSFQWVSRFGLKPTLAWFDCTGIKEFFHVDYSQRDNVSEPNMSWLTLGLYNDTKRVDIKLFGAAPIVLNSSMFNMKKPTMIMLHGFLNSQIFPDIQGVVNSFRYRGGYNILTLDAWTLIGLPFYMLASTNIRFIGQPLGEFIYQLVQAGYDPLKIHLVGHSLGAHMSGFAAKHFTLLSGGTQKIGRISGLDAAGPCFLTEFEEHRLRHTDAHFVDVIHSNCLFFGITIPLGHVDFFPNNGEFQPGCLEPVSAHSRAVLLFIESVKAPDNFLAIKCTDIFTFEKQLCTNNEVIQMGFGAAKYNSSRGVYFSFTSAFPPYAIGESGIRFSKPWIYGIFGQ